MSPIFSGSEAAERLRISREAASKRVQRGMLRHVGGNSNKPGAKPQGELPSSSLAQLSALVAVAGAVTTMFYASGLFVLWAPIARRYTHDISASWHAVSLMPQTSVIGRGFISVWVFSIITFLFTSVIVLLVRSEAPMAKMIVRALRWMNAMLGLFFIFVVGRYIFGALRGTPPKNFYPAFLPFGSTSTEPDKPVSTTETFLSLGVGVCLGVVILFLSVRIFRYTHLAFETRDKADSESSPPPTEENILVSSIKALWNYRLPRIASGSALLKAIAILFTIGFLQATIIAAFAPEPPVPRVELNRKEDTRVEGDLLAHAEGFWYILKLNGDVLAIPDGDVQDARVFADN
jgi:hypothetical protein